MSSPDAKAPLHLQPGPSQPSRRLGLRCYWNRDTPTPTNLVLGGDTGEVVLAVKPQPVQGSEEGLPRGHQPSVHLGWLFGLCRFPAAQLTVFLCVLIIYLAHFLGCILTVTHLFL